MAGVVQTLPELASALDGEVAGGLVIIDRTVLDGVRAPHRTIELHLRAWNGELLGSFGEYPTTEHPIRFTPMPGVLYGVLAPVIVALQSHGVVIDEPAR